MPVKDLNDFAQSTPTSGKTTEIIEEAFSFAQEGPPRASDGAADKIPDRTKGGIAGLWQGFSNIRRTGRKPGGNRKGRSFFLAGRSTP